MRRPDTFDCSKVRNSEKLILEIEIERQTELPLVHNQYVRVFHTTSCLRFKMATNVVLYHSVCSRGLILPDETPTSCCSFVCAFVYLLDRRGDLVSPNNSLDSTH